MSKFESNKNVILNIMYTIVLLTTTKFVNNS